MNIMGKRIIIIEDDGSTNLEVSPYQGLLESFNERVNGYFDPCANCINNPKNNPSASGMCCCSLPDMYNVRYDAASIPFVGYECNTSCSFEDFYNNF